MSEDQRSLAQRLAEAEATIKALLDGQIDAVLDAQTKTPLLLAAAQEALRDSEARYRRILETANEGILTIDTLSKITFVNRRVTEILGYASEDMLGKSLLRFVSEAAAVLSALRTERSQRGISEEYEVSFLRRDGAELWALLKTSPIQDGDKHVGTLVMLTDRTRDRHDQAELRTAEAHYRQIVELAPEGIVKIDGAGLILFTNNRFAEMLGCQPRELVGSSIHDHVSDATKAPLVRLLAQRLATDAVASAFLRNNRRDAAGASAPVEVPVTIRSSTIVTGDGRYVATLAMIRDARVLDSAEPPVQSSQTAS